MEWLNYHHLLYFYTVAKEGRVSRAAKVLRLAQPTLSGQIRKLEHVLDEKRIGSISGRLTSDNVQTENSRGGRDRRRQRTKRWLTSSAPGGRW
jgi:hypothetical protein